MIAVLGREADADAPPSIARAGASQFAEFVEPYLPKMTHLAERLAGPNNRDDVVQEALINAWRKRAQFGSARGSLGGWLMAIVADHARKSWRRKLVFFGRIDSLESSSANRPAAPARQRQQMRGSPSLLSVAIALVLVGCSASSQQSPQPSPVSSPSPVITVFSSPSPEPTPALTPAFTPAATAAPSPSPSPTSPAATPTPRATPVPPSPIAGVVAPWTEATDAGLGHVTDLWAMAENNGIYVLSGQPAAEAWAGQLWFSEDGSHWQRATMPAEPHIDRIHAVAATSSGFAALALDFSGEDTLTHALVSADGRAWHPAGSYPGMGTNLAEIDGRLLAFGDVDRLSDPWYSDDGAATWQQLDADSGRAVANGLLALHQAGGYLWAVRSDNPVEDASIKTPVELWRTSDGLEWDLLGELPGSISVNSAVIATGPKGWVITARRATFSGPGERHDSWFAWRSADGVTWQPASNSPSYVGQIVGVGDAFVAIGRDFGSCCAYLASDVRQKVWTSSDGSAWRQLPEKGWHGREIDFITTVGDRIRGVGMDWLLAPGPNDEAWGVGWEIERDELLP